MKINEIDWTNWIPTERAVISYLFDSKENVLLMHKKRGLGMGKVNVPGGHIEEGESPLDAAIRETKEEVGLNTKNLVQRGMLRFHFLDGLKMEGTVFSTYSYSGTLIETDEAAPFWCPIAKIPYNKMWEDDQYWLPQLLKGKNFTGDFIFDKDKMLDYKLSFFK